MISVHDHLTYGIFCKINGPDQHKSLVPAISVKLYWPTIWGSENRKQSQTGCPLCGVETVTTHNTQHTRFRFFPGHRKKTCFSLTALDRHHESSRIMTKLKLGGWVMPLSEVLAAKFEGRRWSVSRSRWGPDPVLYTGQVSSDRKKLYHGTWYPTGSGSNVPSETSGPTQTTYVWHGPRTWQRRLSD